MTITSKKWKEFIQNNHDGRITQSSLDWLKEYIPCANSVLIAMLNDDNPLALAGCKWGQDNVIQHSILIVDKNYRSKGVGTVLFKMLAQESGRHNIPFKAWIAEDNIASLRAATKAQLKVVSTEVRTRRRNEEFKALQLST